MSVHSRPSPDDMFLPLEDLYFSPHHAAQPAPAQAHQPQEFFAPAAAAAAPAGDNARSSFPEKLHGLIMDAETMGFQDVVSWQDSGKSFKVHKPQIFQNDIIPKYFKPIKYTSFQRQLSIYGFQRIRTGWNTGGYEHPCFSRENPSMCKHIRRHQKASAFSTTATTMKTAPTTQVVPQPVASSSSMMTIMSNSSQYNNIAATPMTSIDDDLFKMYSGDMDPIDAALAQMNNEATTNNVDQHHHHHHHHNHHDFEPLPLGSTCLPRVSSHNDLSHDDHFMLDKLQTCFQEDMHAHGGNIIENPLKAAEAQAADAAASSQNNNNNNNNNKGAFFPAKLHQLLDDAERMNFRHIVSWTDNGRAFQIHNQKEFVGKIMSIYFDQSKFASFRRQLNLYGFNRTRTNNNKNMYFHESFVQGNPKLCEQMFRRCSGGVAGSATTSSTTNKPAPTGVASFAA
eukprot:CAMPEP_0113645438 /NCGR_PEP_ID=MMETSP0017_2-20120614/23951_1 /TAXON_ID=2856 /ORGANISM="Cylindrotheca closterium" /LENGTH=453 /DNA_ID=CAMNT_0000557175 /DNA_START=62 /DNA_END=1423 /DNA_ORIENTATION=+ /assembly_acc=CAM_ASM_000147